MIYFSVDDSAIADHVEAVRQNLLAGIRSGMKDAMEGLSEVVAGKLNGSPIQSRSGALLGVIANSPKVTETDEYIKGTVGGLVNGKPLELWLEEGISVPAVPGHLFGFEPADAQSVFTHGHAAFQVKAKPFMNPSLQEFSPTLMEIIQARVQGAIDAFRS